MKKLKDYMYHFTNRMFYFYKMSFKLGSTVYDENILLMFIPAEGENTFSIFAAVCMILRIDPIHLLLNRKAVDSLWIIKDRGLHIMMPNLDLDPIPDLILTVSINYNSPSFQHVKNIESFSMAIRKQYLNLEYKKEFLSIINGKY